MVKIICLTLGVLGSNKYIGVSGKEYVFHRTGATEVNDREDAENFLKSNNGEAFKKVNKVGTYVENIKDALAEVAKELPGKKKGKKEEEPEVKAEEKAEEKKEEKIPDKEVHDFASLKALNKKDQVILLRKYGGDDIQIPSFEKGRINKILELQKKGVS